MKCEDVIIIGAGPAGIATAIQLKRYGISPLIFERQAIGGLLRNANLVENYPGFPAGIPGLKLVELFRQQAEQIGVTVTYEEVRSLTNEGNRFCVTTQSHSYCSKIAVIASGTRPVIFPDFNLDQASTAKVYYEVYPLAGVRDKRVAIVGAGDAAFDYALNLSSKNQVMILNRGAAVKCLPLLWERASKNPAIRYHTHTQIQHLRAGPGDQITLECACPGGERQIIVDYLIGAIGRQAEMNFLAPKISAKLSQYLDQGTLYLIGDVKHGIYRQTAIAVGDGILAAMKIYAHLIGGSP